MEQSPPGPAPEQKPGPSQQPRPLLMSRTIVLIAMSMLIIGAWFAIDRARTRSVISYGFSFVGMRYEPAGRLCMDEFQLKLAE